MRLKVVPGALTIKRVHTLLWGVGDSSRTFHTQAEQWEIYDFASGSSNGFSLVGFM